MRRHPALPPPGVGPPAGRPRLPASILRLALALGTTLALGSAVVRAQGSPTSPPLTPGGEFEAQADQVQALSRDRIQLTGHVTFRSAGVLLQADRLTYDRATRSGEAEGNVLYAQGGGRVAGARVVFNLEERTAEIQDATGFMEQGFLFRARRLTQLDDQRMRFESAFFTACTQPVPYWSFKVGSGLIVKDRYAHFYNLRLRAGSVPVFYTPYLIFPIKPDRATGVLLPQFGVSERLGTSLSSAFYWNMGRNQDSTYYLDLYNGGSVGGGIEHRLLPSARGRSRLNAYIIDEDGLDDEYGPERQRWNVRYLLAQDLGPRGRLQADFNFVSDGDYFLDFSRDPDRGSDPSALSRGEYIYNSGYTSLNLRIERREQFFAFNDVIQSRLPEAELRLRSRRLGRSPFFLALESSAALLDKKAPGFPEGAYGRVDVFPTLSVPLSPLPYLDLTPTLRMRETFYSQALDPNDPEAFGDSLSREFVQFDVQALGPRLSRVFFDEEGNGRRKSTIEPRLTYRYQTAPGSEENFRVPGFDEIDVLPGELNEVEYGVVTRLYARKVVRTPADPEAPDEAGPVTRDEAAAEAREMDDEAASEAGALAGEAAAGEAGAGSPGRVAPMGQGLPGQVASGNDWSLSGPGREAADKVLTSPVEIVNVSLTQRYSLDLPLSFDTEFQDTTGDGLPDTLEVVDDSNFSPVTLAARFNPSVLTSVDARLAYDVLEQTVSSASLSAGLYSLRRGFLSATWFFTNGLSGLDFNESRLRVSGGTSFLRHKMSVAVSLNYDASRQWLQDQRYRFGYDTQCCGFAFEVLDRDFIGTRQREFRFVLNLRGIGNFLDLQGGGSGQ